MGKTKIFIRYPETLFHLEECLDRRDYEMTIRIQKAWKHWKARKHQLEQRAMAADLLRGKKERQRDSITRTFEFDYIRTDANFSLRDAMKSGGGDRDAVAFADQVLRLNGRSRPERRDLVVTDKAVYLVQRKKKGQHCVL